MGMGGEEPEPEVQEMSCPNCGYAEQVDPDVFEMECPECSAPMEAAGMGDDEMGGEMPPPEEPGMGGGGFESLDEPHIAFESDLPNPEDARNPQRPLTEAAALAADSNGTRLMEESTGNRAADTVARVINIRKNWK
jgi:hypothetical protein